MTEEEAHQMREVIIRELRVLLDQPTFDISPPSICTMTVTAQLAIKPNFEKLSLDKDCSFETELFPAAILSHWSPMKVVLFRKGHINITGVKNISDCHRIIELLQSSLCSIKE